MSEGKPGGADATGGSEEGDPTTTRPEWQGEPDPIERFLEGYFENSLFLLRHIAIVPVVFSFIGAILMFGLGIYETSLAVGEFIRFNFDGVTLPLIKALDAYLIGIILMIFSFGIYDFFISEFDPDTHGTFRPDWLKFDDVGGLKHKIVEVVLVILAIAFFELMLVNFESFDSFLEYLTIPIGTAIFALAIGGFRKLTHG